MEAKSEAEDALVLEAIRADLQAVRGCLMRSGLGDTREMAERLRAVVERFRQWTSAGAVAREDVEEIRRELGGLQPLFENAYALHSGWFALAGAGASYDAEGNPVNAATAGNALDFGESPVDAVRG